MTHQFDGGGHCVHCGVPFNQGATECVGPSRMELHSDGQPILCLTSVCDHNDRSKVYVCELPRDHVGDHFDKKMRVGWRGMSFRDEIASQFRQRDGDQPLPTHNDNPAIQDLLVADVEERKKLGVRRYGTLLQGHNGRDALLDAYQEALDLCVYLRQVIWERDNPREKETNV